MNDPVHENPSTPSSVNPTADPTASPPPPSNTLPIVALLTTFLCSPIGVILSIVALVKFNKAKGTTAKTLSVIALVLNLLLILPMTLGVLAAIALPNFHMFQCRSKQAEAKGNLKALYVGEEIFRAEEDRYSGSLSDIGFQPKGAKIRYEYTILTAGERSFLAEAVGTGDMSGDRWTISSNNDLQNTDNACR
jgi:Tfp pilus assembly protein PilE